MDYVSKVESNVTKTLSGYNLIKPQQMQYHDEVIMRLIDGGGQGTITWGIVFLTTFTLFFTILLGLRNKTKDSEPLSSVNNLKNICRWVENNPSDTVLSISALIFLVIGMVSIFQMVYYYRYVGYLQYKLQTIPPTPHTWIYPFIINFECLMLVFSTILVIFCIKLIIHAHRTMIRYSKELLEAKVDEVPTTD